MAAVGVEEDPVVQAARILLNLRHRRLQRWPEWVPKEPEPAAVEADACLPPPLERWPKRQRNGNRVRSSSWAASWALPKQQEREPPVVASAGYGAGEEREPSPAPPPRWRGERSSVGPVRDDRRPSGSPAFCSSPAGSGPSTSADRKARPCRAVETTTATPPGSAGAPRKQPHMKEWSPETPLDLCGAGSGASSSGDDGAAAKRRALGSASSGDEGCSSSPDKRARVVDAGDDRHGEKQQAVSEPKTQTPDADKDKDKGGVVVKFEFDLNMPCPEDDECAAAGFW